MSSAAVNSKIKNDKITDPGVWVNPEQVDKDVKKALEYDGTDAKKYSFPVGMYHNGRFTYTDPKKDRQYEIMKKLKDEGIKPTINYDKDMVEYIDEKEAQEYYIQHTLQAAEKLIDPSDPNSSSYAYTIYPELKELPDQLYDEQVAIQAALRQILKEGRIRGKEDHELILKICSKDYVIPMMPIWDPNGVLLSPILDDNAKKQLGLTPERQQLGLFNPLRFFDRDQVKADPNQNGQGQQKDSSAGSSESQKKIKKLILRRVYPGFRNAPDAELETFLKGPQPRSGNLYYPRYF